MNEIYRHRLEKLNRSVFQISTKKITSARVEKILTRESFKDGGCSVRSKCYVVNRVATENSVESVQKVRAEIVYKKVVVTIRIVQRHITVTTREGDPSAV